MSARINHQKSVNHEQPDPACRAHMTGTELTAWQHEADRVEHAGRRAQWRRDASRWPPTAPFHTHAALSLKYREAPISAAMRSAGHIRMSLGVIGAARRDQIHG